MLTKDEAKEKLRIPEIWSRYNLPGKPAKSCPSPFREDRHPSFSVSPDGKLWNDFATGEGGDAIDFLSRIQQTGAFTRVSAFVELAASIFGDPSPTTRPEDRVMPSPGRVPPRPKVNVPEPEPEALRIALNALRPPSEDDCRIIAVCRGLDPVACYLAGQIGTLLVGSVGGFDCWILTDQRRRLAEARRLDGALFPAVGTLGERKAHTLKGSKKDWPIGILPRLAGHERIRKILLVEGGPDYLAAMHIIALGGSDCLPVAVLGAACGKDGMHPDAEKLFRRRRVRIIRHNGASAADAWFKCLSEGKGCDVDMMESGEPRAKDLNDLVRLKPPSEIIKILP